MTVYFDKDRRKWRYDFWRRSVRYVGDCVDQDGAPASSKRVAVEAENIEKRKVSIAPKLPSGPAFSLAQALADLTPVWELQASWSNKKRYVNEIGDFFGRAKLMADFDEAEVSRYVTHCITSPVMRWTGGPKRDPDDPDNAHYWRDSGRKRGPRTSNLYLGVLRKVVEHAGKVRDPITREPALREVPEVPELAFAKRKARPVPETVQSALMETLPAHVVEAIALTLFFGFRRAEVFGLQIPHVDFDSKGINLLAEEVKDNEDAFMPGSPEAMAYLRHLVDQAIARGTMFLVTYRPYRKDPAKQVMVPYRPIKRPKGAWTRAMDEIEEQFGRRWRWHDMRAAFITYVARTSGQLAAQTLARHSEFDSTKAYIDVADEFTREASHRAARRPSLAVIPGGRSPTFVSHPAKKRGGKKTANILK